MKNFKQLCLVVMTAVITNYTVILAAEPDATTPPKSPPITAPALSGPLGKPIQLFNGKDLKGWVWYQQPPKSVENKSSGKADSAKSESAKSDSSKPDAPKPDEAKSDEAKTGVVGIEEVWSVNDGVLRCKGKPTGYIRTSHGSNMQGSDSAEGSDKSQRSENLQTGDNRQQGYNNYVLTVEQRHLGKGNGGILFALSGPDKIWPHCLEAQGANGEEGDIRNIADFKLTMDQTRVEPRRLKRIGPSSEKPPGEWETIVVTVDHGLVTITVNGQFQNTATAGDAESLNGQIGLQSEGGEMEFRKVELRPIE
ncbi:MAG TPA: DUF1080 domain-containing protein [Pirellulales bacterium]